MITLYSVEMTSLREQVEEYLQLNEFVVLNAERCTEEQFGDKYFIEKERVEYELTRGFEFEDLNDIDSQIAETFCIECSRGRVDNENDEYPTHEAFLFDKKGMKISGGDGGTSYVWTTFSKDVDVYILCPLQSDETDDESIGNSYKRISPFADWIVLPRDNNLDIESLIGTLGIDMNNISKESIRDAIVI